MAEPKSIGKTGAIKASYIDPKLLDYVTGASSTNSEVVANKNAAMNRSAADEINLPETGMFITPEMQRKASRFDNIDNAIFYSNPQAFKEMQDYNRYAQQSALEDILKGSGRILTTAAAEFTKGLTILGSAPIAALTSDASVMWDNFLYNGIEDVKNFINDNALQVYTDPNNTGLGSKISDISWWATSGADGIGFMASMLIPGSDIVAALGKAATLGKGVSMAGMSTKILSKSMALQKVLDRAIDVVPGVSKFYGKTNGLVKSLEEAVDVARQAGKMDEVATLTTQIAELEGKLGLYSTGLGKQYAKHGFNATYSALVEGSAEAAGYLKENLGAEIEKLKLKNPQLSDEEATKMAKDKVNSYASNVLFNNVALLVASNMIDEIFLFDGMLGGLYKRGLYGVDPSDVGSIVRRQIDNTGDLVKAGKGKQFAFAGAQTAIMGFKEGLEEVAQGRLKKEQEERMNDPEHKEKNSIITTLSALRDMVTGNLNETETEEAFLGSFLGAIMGGAGSYTDIKNTHIEMFGGSMNASKFSQKILRRQQKDVKGIYTEIKDMISDIKDPMTIKEYKANGYLDEQNNLTELGKEKISKEQVNKLNLLKSIMQAEADGNQIGKRLLQNQLVDRQLTKIMSSEHSEPMLEAYSKMLADQYKDFYEQNGDKAMTEDEYKETKDNILNRAKRIKPIVESFNQGNYTAWQLKKYKSDPEFAKFVEEQENIRMNTALFVSRFMEQKVMMDELAKQSGLTQEEIENVHLKYDENDTLDTFATKEEAEVYANNIILKLNKKLQNNEVTQSDDTTTKLDELSDNNILDVSSFEIEKVTAHGQERYIPVIKHKYNNKDYVFSKKGRMLSSKRERFYNDDFSEKEDRNKNNAASKEAITTYNKRIDEIEGKLKRLKEHKDYRSIRNPNLSGEQEQNEEVLTSWTNNPNMDDLTIDTDPESSEYIRNRYMYSVNDEYIRQSTKDYNEIMDLKSIIKKYEKYRDNSRLKAKLEAEGKINERIYLDVLDTLKDNKYLRKYKQNEPLYFIYKDSKTEKSRVVYFDGRFKYHNNNKDINEQPYLSDSVGAILLINIQSNSGRLKLIEKEDVEFLDDLSQTIDFKLSKMAEIENLYSKIDKTKLAKRIKISEGVMQDYLINKMLERINKDIFADNLDEDIKAIVSKISAEIADIMLKTDSFSIEEYEKFTTNYNRKFNGVLHTIKTFKTRPTIYYKTINDKKTKVDVDEFYYDIKLDFYLRQIDDVVTKLVSENIDNVEFKTFIDKYTAKFKITDATDILIEGGVEQADLKVGSEARKILNGQLKVLKDSITFLTALNIEQIKAIEEKGQELNSMGEEVYDLVKKLEDLHESLRADKFDLRAILGNRELELYSHSVEVKSSMDKDLEEIKKVKEALLKELKEALANDKYNKIAKQYIEFLENDLQITQEGADLQSLIRYVFGKYKPLSKFTEADLSEKYLNDLYKYAPMFGVTLSKTDTFNSTNFIEYLKSFDEKLSISEESLAIRFSNTRIKTEKINKARAIVNNYLKVLHKEKAITKTSKLSDFGNGLTGGIIDELAYFISGQLKSDLQSKIDALDRRLNNTLTDLGLAEPFVRFEIEGLPEPVNEEINEEQDELEPEINATVTSTTPIENVQTESTELSVQSQSSANTNNINAEIERNKLEFLETNVGEKVIINNIVGTLKKQNENIYELHTTNSIYELQLENVKTYSEFKEDDVKEKQVKYNVENITETTVTVNNFDYVINNDSKGNIESLSPLNKLEQKIKNEKLLISVEIERNKLETLNTELNNSILEEVSKNYKNLDELLNVIWDINMTDTIAEGLDKLYENKTLNKNEELQISLWLSDVFERILNLVNNKNTPEENELLTNAYNTAEFINSMLFNVNNLTLNENGKEQKAGNVTEVKTNVSTKKSKRRIKKEVESKTSIETEPQSAPTTPIESASEDYKKEDVESVEDVNDVSNQASQDEADNDNIEEQTQKTPVETLVDEILPALPEKARETTVDVVEEMQKAELVETVKLEPKKDLNEVIINPMTVDRRSFISEPRNMDDYIDNAVIDSKIPYRLIKSMNLNDVTQDEIIEAWNNSDLGKDNKITKTGC